MTPHKLITHAVMYITISVYFCTQAGCSDPDFVSVEVPVFTPSALIVTSDFQQAGAYSIANPNSLEIYNTIEVVHQDSSCRISNGTPYIISSMGADSIVTLSPWQNWQVESEFSVGPGTNPQDIAVLNNQKAYVALLNEPHIKIIHPGTGNTLGKIDLFDFADGDGLPETAWLLIHDNVLCVLLQRLDSTNGYRPTDQSLLVTIDTTTDKIIDSIPLTGTNPFAKFRFNTFIEQFVVIESGIFSSVHEDALLDDGIELFNPKTGQLSGFITTAEKLGGDIVDAVLVSMQKAYAIVGNAGDTNLVSFNPQNGTPIRTLIDYNIWALATLELSPTGTHLWVADRHLNHPGIRIFNTQTDLEIPNSPIETSLPPTRICFWE